MKNPDSKPLRIVRHGRSWSQDPKVYTDALAQLATAEAILVRAGKSSAMPHFIAIVKELENVLGFKFEQIPEE
jgi:hypothetical protein